jgi:DNA replication protein DnaC
MSSGDLPQSSESNVQTTVIPPAVTGQTGSGSDAAAKTRLAEAMRTKRELMKTDNQQKVATRIGPVIRNAVERLSNAADATVESESQIVLPAPQRPDHRSRDTASKRTAANPRPWPASAGPSDWEKVAAPFRESLQAAITERRWPIYIFGDVGIGKTCAAACVYHNWRQSALWFECGRILADIIECRMSPDHLITRVYRSPGADEDGRTWQEGEGAIMRKIADTSLVVFNDVGLRKPSEAAFEIFLTMLDLRLGKPTIYTSNLEPERLDQLFDDRVASRLLRGSVIHVVGDDRRSVNSRFVRVKAVLPAPSTQNR